MVSNILKVNQNIILFGGGRWAKIIIKVLIKIINSENKIYIYTKKCQPLIRDWLLKKNINNRVFVLKDLNDTKKRNIKVAIVANSPKDHFKSASWALTNNLDVLIEKPLCLNRHEYASLVNLSKKSEGDICAGHVFNYLQSFQVFKKRIPDINDIHLIEIKWIDPEIEERHGEIKKISPKIPLYFDILPHIFSIIKTIWNTYPKNINNTNISKSSSSIYFETLIGDTQCNITIDRLGQKRERVLETFGKNKNCKLDFSKEPGFIELNGSALKIEKIISEKIESPLNTMLQSFLSYSSNKEWDERLSTESVIKFLKFTEILDIHYLKNIKQLLNKLNKDNYLLSRGDNYLIYELMHQDKFKDREEVKEIIKKLVEKIQFRKDIEFNPQKFDELNL